jgi:hypothetical protein
MVSGGIEALLQVGDTPDQTVGCRMRCPMTCRKRQLREVCAVARRDGICMAPPRGWRERFAELKAASEMPAIPVDGRR